MFEEFEEDKEQERRVLASMEEEEQKRRELLLKVLNGEMTKDELRDELLPDYHVANLIEPHYAPNEETKDSDLVEFCGKIMTVKEFHAIPAKNCFICVLVLNKKVEVKN